MGKAYESLGRAEAFSIYERVLREFADQSGEVAEARVRMAGLAEPASPDTEKAQPTIIRQLGYHYVEGREGPPLDLYGAAPSPSGRLLVRHGGDAKLVVSDLASGDETELDLSGTACDGYFMTARFSPDERSVAASCWESIYLVNLDSGEVRTLVEGARFLDLPEDFHFETEVYDWTDDGAYVLASIQGWQTGDERRRHHVALVPLGDRQPIVIDDNYWSDDRDFREMNACLMNADIQMFGEYTVEEGEGADTRTRMQIRRLGVESEEEVVVLGDALYDYELFGCDRRRALLYYSRRTTTDRQLWAASVGADGGLVAPRFLRIIPSDADPVMSQNGAIYYSQNLSGEWMGVEATMDAGGALSGDPKITGEDWFVHRYAPNGSYIAEESASGLSYFGTPEGLRIPLSFTEGYQAHVRGVTGDHFIFRHDVARSTWLVRSFDGAVVDSLPGVYARWVSKDLREVYRMEIVNDERCLIREARDTSAFSTLVCSGEAERGFATEFDPESGDIAIWGRKEGIGLLEYFDSDSGSLVPVMDLEPRSYMIRWAGGKLYIMKIVGTEMWRFDPSTGKTKPITVLADMYERGLMQSSNQLGVKLDGSAFQTHYKIFAQGETFELFVIPDPLKD
jgi:hypothetical protein